jgi:general secretion pathway protein A
VAGVRSGVVFSRTALKRIYRYSRGLPRLINAVCDRALLAGYTRDNARVNSRIAGEGIKDIRKNSESSSRKRRLILVPIFGILGALLTIGIYFTWYDYSDRFNASQRIEAKAEQAKKDPAVTGEEVSRAIAAELGKVPESESIRRAFNNLARIWNVPPVPESVDVDGLKRLERAALDRGLRLYAFAGNLGTLLNIDYPAVLELTMPGIPGKRYISLVGIQNDQLLVDPQVAERRSLSFSELEKHWSGQGYFLWKDPMNLLARISPRSKGKQITLLQGLLKEAGAYNRPPTGIYDGNTVLAVKNFQSLHGIERDGIAGVKTLMILYRSIDRFKAARLTVAGQK